MDDAELEIAEVILMPTTEEIVPEPVCIGGDTIDIALTDWEEEVVDLKDERRFCADDLRRMVGRATSEKWDIASQM